MQKPYPFRERAQVFFRELSRWINISNAYTQVAVVGLCRRDVPVEQRIKYAKRIFKAKDWLETKKLLEMRIERNPTETGYLEDTLYCYAHPGMLAWLLYRGIISERNQVVFAKRIAREGRYRHAREASINTSLNTEAMDILSRRCLGWERYLRTEPPMA